MSLTEVEATASPKTFASLYDNTALNEDEQAAPPSSPPRLGRVRIAMRLGEIHEVEE